MEWNANETTGGINGRMEGGGWNGISEERTAVD